MACLKKRTALTRVARRRYRNPIILAQEWQIALAEGRYASPAALSRHIGVSRARVTQILKLLKLSPEALEEVVALGDPLPSPVVTERSLRPLADLPTEEQKRVTKAMLAKKHHYQLASHSAPPDARPLLSGSPHYQ